MTNLVTLKDLSVELGLDKSNLRKYILDKFPHIDLVKIRTTQSRGQLTLALPAKEAEAIKEFRQKNGFLASKNPKVVSNGEGYFYIIQVVPELDPNRIKLGFASSMDNRLQAHRTAAPTANLVKCWPCKKTWEDTAIASLTRVECKLIASEIFICDNLNTLVERGDSFFNQLPLPDFKIDNISL